MKRKVLYNVLGTFFIGVAISCSPINATERDTEAQEAAATEQAPMLMASLDVKEAKPVDPKKINPSRIITPGGAELYNTAPKPLTVEQCAQCHTSVFNKVKNDGGRHRIHCQDCHIEFHSYSPAKNNFQEIMPKCSQCHVDPHGPKFPNCITCHTIPHTPLNVALNDLLSAECGNCHTGPADELVKFPSLHTTEVACDSCHHSKHGNIPSCMECHEPHVANQPISECLACHPVHSPRQISYGAGTESTCATCHGDVYESWFTSPSRHAGVACADCHQSHGEIPECSMCHSQPHDPKMLAKFPRCLDCHIDVHNPPVNK